MIGQGKTGWWVGGICAAVVLTSASEAAALAELEQLAQQTL